MPALTDKIFLPISIFVLNIVLAVFRFVLVSAVGACFAIYAKYGGEYAKSIGWVRSAGYLDMIKAFLSTFKRKNAPGSVLWVLVVGFFITLAANFMDKGISNFVTPGIRLVPLGKEVVANLQAKSDVGVFFGWSFVVPINGNVTNTMEKALNSSLAIPNPHEGKVYSPVTSRSPTTCADFGITFFGATLRNGSCGGVEIKLAESKIKSNISTSSNRMGFVGANLGITSAYSINDHEDAACNLHEDARTVDMSNSNDARISRTSTTKCFHKSGDITVLAMTTTRFTDFVDLPLTNDSVLYSGISDELFSTMYETIGLYDLPQSYFVSLVLVELRLTNSSIDILTCTARNPAPYIADLLYECVYATITMLRFKQNNDIIEAFGSDFDYGTYRDSVYISLEYFPVPTSEAIAPMSTAKFNTDNADVALYMARLGTNYFADFNKRLVYIQYDVEKLELGLEVPLWVLLAAGLIMIVSVCVWQSTHWIVGSPHTSSVYGIIRNELGSKSGTPAPRVMRFSHQPLMLEGVKLLPDEAKTFPEDIKLV
jgi:hypothetical protein